MISEELMVIQIFILEGGKKLGVYALVHCVWAEKV
jgi:hypothetical protein